jgi:hypothetical protein
MTAASANDAAMRDYLDALLQESAPPAPEPTQDDSATVWQMCKLGHLQLLLCGGALGAPIGIDQVATPPVAWHLAHVRIGSESWRVAELAPCIAPGLAGTPVDTLLPVTGIRWLLAVPGRPLPLHLPDAEIEWRTQRSSRPWLLGMSREGRHMLLDARALIADIAHNVGTLQKESLP